MKIKNIVMILIIMTVIVACAPSVTLAPRAEFFAFVFQTTLCGSIPVNVLVTALGSLVYTPLGATTSTTVALRSTYAELESIYQKATSICFFAYPSEFTVPDDQVLGSQEPATRYQLSMNNGEMMNSVVWTDDTITKPEYTKADQLRELMNLINGIIQSRPEVQEL